MHTKLLKIIFSLAAAAALAVPTASAFGADKEVNIAFQTVVEPAKVAQADGEYEKASGWKITWKKFSSGGDMITAVASGDIDIGYVGSSPLAAAATRGLPIETIFIAAEIGNAEALVVRNGSGIDKQQDLVGKKVTVPFVSTTHYSLLAALKHWKIDPKSVQILNFRRPEIADAWSHGDIQSAAQFLVTDVVVMGIFVIAILAFAFDWALRRLQRACVPWAVGRAGLSGAVVSAIKCHGRYKKPTD